MCANIEKHERNGSQHQQEKRKLRDGLALRLAVGVHRFLVVEREIGMRVRYDAPRKVVGMIEKSSSAVITQKQRDQQNSEYV